MKNLGSFHEGEKKKLKMRETRVGQKRRDYLEEEGKEKKKKKEEEKEKKEKEKEKSRTSRGQSLPSFPAANPMHACHFPPAVVLAHRDMSFLR